MEVVADTLRTEAVNRSDVGQKDLFGRSAYNRFYYSTFLIVREMVVRMDGAWKSLPHADYPQLLSGKVRKRLQDGRRAARKMDDWELVGLCENAAFASNELAEIMKTGSATRVVADYEPNIPIHFSGTAGFSLQSVSVSEASDWPRRARFYCRLIERAWKEIDNG